MLLSNLSNLKGPSCGGSNIVFLILHDFYAFASSLTNYFSMCCNKIFHGTLISIPTESTASNGTKYFRIHKSNSEDGLKRK